MKHKFISLTIAIAAFSLFSCSKMNDNIDQYLSQGEIIYIAKSDSVKTYAGKERFQVDFWISDSRASEMRIFWNQYRDSLVVPIPESHDIKNPISTILDKNQNIEEGNYTLHLVTYDKFGNKSIPDEYLVNAYGDMFSSTLLSREIVSAKYDDAISSMNIVWGGSSSVKEIGVKIFYTNMKGEKMEKVFSSDQLREPVLITDVNADEEFLYETLFLPEPGAIDVFNTEKEILEFERAMTAKEAEIIIQNEREKFIESCVSSYQTMWDNQVFTYGKYQMPIKYRIYGDKPADGRSLYISLHGGGNTSPEVNDQQWENQLGLYQPKEGVYLTPRAHVDDWNMWFRNETDQLLDRIIQATVAILDVNPNKVYLMGYSAGGDGVWRLAPRLADHWASASMMAGHPGDVSLVNLRNLPFMIWVGENDSDYDRNTICAAKGAELDKLHAEDPSGYIHETHVVPGKGHWMDLEDKAAIDWMPKFKRNPYPDKIVWRQESITKVASYWLEIDKSERNAGNTVIVSHDGNVFNIEECDYSKLNICLNDFFVDLNKPIIVNYKGKKIFEDRLVRDPFIIEQTIRSRRDLDYVFSAKISLELN